MLRSRNTNNKSLIRKHNLVKDNIFDPNQKENIINEDNIFDKNYKEKDNIQNNNNESDNLFSEIINQNHKSKPDKEKLQLNCN